MPIDPLPEKISGTKPTAWDKAFHEKIDTLVAAANTGEAADAAHAGKIAAIEARLAKLEGVVTPPPPPPPPPTDPELPRPPVEPGPSTLATVLGPIPRSLSAVRALGGGWQRWADEFPPIDERQWQTWPATGKPMYDALDYYDRAAIYYTWAEMLKAENPTLAATYRTRGAQVAVSFRDQYLVPNSYGLIFNWAMMDGLTAHYLTTGDTASLLAVARVGEAFWYNVRADPDRYFSVPQDLRINAYAINAFLNAWMVNAPSDGGSSQGWGKCDDWAVALRTAMPKVLALRNPDGQWRTARIKEGAPERTTHPYTIGLLYDALVQYYTFFEADPRIPQAIRTSADILWRDDWVVPGVKYANPYDPSEIRTSTGGFKQSGVPSVESGDEPSADLNNLIVNGYAFLMRLAERGGDSATASTMRSRVEAIVAGAMNYGAQSQSGKHTNQYWTSSHRAAAWRLGA